MSYWGKIIGGVAGFAMAGPFGAMLGAALGHAADSGVTPNLQFFGPNARINPARLAAMLGGREQLFSFAVVVLSAKLAKSDGPVKREEIETFKRLFRVPPDSLRHVGRLFDQAREDSENFELYARELGQAFADNRGVLEDVLSALFTLARTDGPLNRAEHAFLSDVHRAFGLDQAAWDRARGGVPRGGGDAPDPYTVLGVSPSASLEDIRATWKRLMRENHPDSLASRGVPADFIARASEQVARINAAWDRIKRERS